MSVPVLKKFETLIQFKNLLTWTIHLGWMQMLHDVVRYPHKKWRGKTSLVFFSDQVDLRIWLTMCVYELLETFTFLCSFFGFTFATLLKRFYFVQNCVFTVQDVVWSRMNSNNKKISVVLFFFHFCFWRWKGTRTRQRVVEEARG